MAPLCNFGEADSHTAIPVDVASQNATGSPYCQDGIVPNTMMPVPGMPYAMSGVPMPMCYASPMCYVVMPTQENTALRQHSKQMQEEWSQNANQHWGESRPQSWATHSQASTGYSTPERRVNNNKSHSNSVSSLGSWSSSQLPDSSEMTTVILRNLPIECTRDMFLQLLDAEGFAGRYDFLHLPTAFNTKVGLGYALLNLTTHEGALNVLKHFEGLTNWPCNSDNDNICEASWNSPQQGLETHVDRYRNSPLMHSSIPEAYRPVVFEDGVRVKFPAPTERIRAPRLRHQKPGKDWTQRPNQTAAGYM